MIHIPLNPCCSKCKTEGIDNLNMIISIKTEQPLSYFRELPNKININLKTSRNSSWVNWEDDNNTIVCRNCGFTSKNYSEFNKN